MIQANEFRLGNWLYEKSTNGDIIYFQVNLDYLEAIEAGDHVFKPIPLTPAILEKTNLKYSDGYDDIKGWEISPSVWLSQLSSGKWYVGYEFEDNSRWHCLGQVTEVFEYLHQFQNLYFDIMRQELQVNL